MKIPTIRIPKLKNPAGAADKFVTLLGITCIIIGAYQIYKPAAWITTGIVLAFPGMPRKAVK